MSELDKIIKIKRNKASVVIITSNGSSGRLFCFQKKTMDYPIEEFAGTYCFFGGNAEENDKDHLDTLQRELTEELSSASFILSNSIFFQTFEIKVPLKNKPEYHYLPSIYIANVTEEELKKFKTDICMEGKVIIVSEKEIHENPKHQFCWGYDYVFQYYLESINSQTKVYCKPNIKCSLYTN